jgi:hypothetical protein
MSGGILCAIEQLCLQQLRFDRSFDNCCPKVGKGISVT